MGVIVDPDTGRLVSEATAKAIIDSRMRVLTPVGDRPIDTGFGSLLYESLGGLPEVVGVLEPSMYAALLAAPLYTPVNVRVVQEGTGTLRVEVFIRLPDGTPVVIPIEPPNLPPVVEILTQGRTLAPGEVLSLTARAHDPDGRIEKYSWTIEEA